MIKGIILINGIEAKVNIPKSLIKCPKCKSKIIFEDHSIIGGDVNYWTCENCGEEKEMFGIN